MVVNWCFQIVGGLDYNHGCPTESVDSRSFQSQPTLFLSFSFALQGILHRFALQIPGCKVHDPTVAKNKRQHRRIWILVALSVIEAMLSCSFVES